MLYGQVLRFISWRFQGINLAIFIEQTMNPVIRGRVEVADVTWPTWRWPLYLLGGVKVPLQMTAVRLYDPLGQKVLDAPFGTGELDAPALLVPWGHGDLYVDHLTLLPTQDGRRPWAFVQQYPNPIADPERPFEIGFLNILAPRVERRHPPGYVGGEIRLRDFSLNDVDLVLEFLPGWKGTFHGLSTRGRLTSSYRDYLHPTFTYAIEPTATSGSLDVGNVHVDLTDVRSTRFGQFLYKPNAWAFSLTAHSAEGGEVALAGELGNLYDPLPHRGTVDLSVVLGNGGPLVARLSGGQAGGDALSATVGLAGLLAAPVFSVNLMGLDVHALPMPLRVLALDGTYDSGSGEAVVRKLSVAALGGRAEITADANVPLRRVHEVTIAIPEAMDVGPYLPAETMEIAGGTSLGGSVRLTGAGDGVDVDPIDLRLGDAHLDGTATLYADSVDARGLKVTLPDGTISVNGVTPLPAGVRLPMPTSPEQPGARKLVDAISLTYAVEAHRLQPWLRRLGAPAVATGLSARGAVGGTLAAPEAGASVNVFGVPILGRVDLDLAYHAASGVLDVKRISSHSLGGLISGHARLHLGSTIEIADASLGGQGLSLGLLPGLPLPITGTIDFTLGGHGTSARPRFVLDVGAHGLAVAGFPIGAGDAALAIDERGVAIDSLRLGEGATGTFAASGRVDFDGSLALRLALAHVPLGMLPQVHGQTALGLDGRVALDADIGGTLRAPRVSGTLALSGFTVFGDLLGSGRLDLVPVRDGQVHVKGKLFQGKFNVDLDLALAAPYAASGRITFRRVEIDEFFPALADAIGAHGWVTGTADFQTAPALTAQLHLTEAQVSLDGVDDRGRPQPLTVRSDGDIDVAYDGRTGTATFSHPIWVKSDRGTFTVAGSASMRTLALDVQGKVQIALLEFYTKRWVERAEGSVDVDVHVTGTLLHPLLAGDVAFEDASVLLHGQEQPILVPKGRVSVAGDQARIDDLTVMVDGQSLLVNGQAALADLIPVNVDVLVEGRIPGVLLAMLLPRQISHASGSAAARLAVKGAPTNPSVDGVLRFDQPLAFSPRGLRREIVLRSGEVRLSNRALALTGVGGTIEEGQFSLLGGDGPTATVRLDSWSPRDVDVRAIVSGFPYRLPDTLDMELDADLRLTGNMTQLVLGGALRSA